MYPPHKNWSVLAKTHKKTWISYFEAKHSKSAWQRYKPVKYGTIICYSLWAGLKALVSKKTNEESIHTGAATFTRNCWFICYSETREEEQTCSCVAGRCFMRCLFFWTEEPPEKGRLWSLRKFQVGEKKKIKKWRKKITKIWTNYFPLRTAVPYGNNLRLRSSFFCDI